MEEPTIYLRNVHREKNDRSVSVHNCGDVWLKSAEACSGKEITGLLKKTIMMMKNNYYDDTKIVKLHVSRLLRGKLEADRSRLGQIHPFTVIIVRIKAPAHGTVVICIYV